MLDIWPELPVYIYDDCNNPTKEATDSVVAALRLNHRVSGIRLEYTPDSAWEIFALLMQQPFPALTQLCIQSYGQIETAVSCSLLGGSAPRLRDLDLYGVPFPALPGLLLSTTNLVRLRYDDIPTSGYIPPQAMVTGLSALTRLESLSLTFHSPPSPPNRAIPIPPPHTCALFPALTSLRFQCVPGYLEVIVAQIDAPLLQSIVITLFTQEVLEVPELAKFICRTHKLSSTNRAEVTFKSEHITFTLSQTLWRVDPKTLKLNLTCCKPDLRLSYLAQFCGSCLPSPSLFECLHILVPLQYTWHSGIYEPDPQWLELLRPFNAVKHLRLSQEIAPFVADYLSSLPAERVTDVLPALEVVFISRLEFFDPEYISDFVDARQLSGHPVSIYDWKGEVYCDELWQL